MDCIFCKIISGEIPSHKLYEDDDFIVIRDINPVAPVHLLVIYKKHVERIDQLSDEDMEKMKNSFRIISRLVEAEGIKEDGYRVVVNNGEKSGQEVNHIHIHVIGGKKLGGIC